MFGRPAPVGATPVAEQPTEPLRGQFKVVTSAIAEVTSLNQDLTEGEGTRKKAQGKRKKAKGIANSEFRMTNL